MTLKGKKKKQAQRPPTVWGDTSPYPTVVPVTMDQ
jgi:hypothetical protein